MRMESVHIFNCVICTTHPVPFIGPNNDFDKEIDDFFLDDDSAYFFVVYFLVSYPHRVPRPMPPPRMVTHHCTSQQKRINWTLPHLFWNMALRQTLRARRASHHYIWGPKKAMRKWLVFLTAGTLLAVFRTYLLFYSCCSCSSKVLCHF